jgi:predicted TIM-barrel fold metal-dependent hydrolase
MAEPMTHHSRRSFLARLAACGIGSIAGRGGLRAQAPPKSGLIDVHHHILPPALLTGMREYLASAWRISGRQQIPPAILRDWSPGRSVEEMDKNGVAVSILSFPSAVISPDGAESARTLARKINEYGAKLVQDYPGRFGLFATVPLPDTEGSLKEIAYALDVLNADGVCLMSSYGDKWPGDPVYVPVLEELNRRKSVVYFHPFMPGCCVNLIPSVSYLLAELPHDTTRAVTSLLFSGLLTRFREIRFILAHAGGTLPILADRIAYYSAQMKDMADKTPDGVEYELKRFYYDVASSANPPAMAALMKLVDTSHILFGSDYPAVPVAYTANGLKRLGLRSANLQAILRDNAMKLMPRLRS